MIGVFKKILSAYLVDYPRQLAYMLQQSEYHVLIFWKWWLRAESFKEVAKRGALVSTRNARLVRVLLGSIALTYWIVNLLSIYLLRTQLTIAIPIAVLAILLYPVAVVILSTPIITILSFVNAVVVSRRVREARKHLREHPGIIIAVAGSYGKTSAKEMIVQLLAGSVNVAATSGNQNTLLSQAKFIETLGGREDVVVVEMGEGAPGDVRKMTDFLQPDYAVITGLAPNHLDAYKSVDAIVEDFMYLCDFVGKERTFINADNVELKEHFAEKATTYSAKGFDGWRVSAVELGIHSVSFVLAQAKERIDIHVSLLGRHNIGPLTMAIVLALRLGASYERVLQRISTLRPHEHRMQPRDLGGMWMIDDTYNGNIEGLLAGLEYLKEIKASGRKLYATPGLVDQGDMTEEVHTRLGKAIAKCKPDEVYLMNNSVAEIIQNAALESGYKGKITVIDNPLSFYTNLKDVLAVGDVILCQNDWPDNYA